MKRQRTMSRLVPAWQVQTGSCSTPGWVHIFTPGQTVFAQEWPQVRTVDALMPVDADEQARLAAHRPDWLNKENP
jgi:hypothetical protein